jgi:hypothetical protein
MMSKQATRSERENEPSEPAAPAPVGIAIVDQIDASAHPSAETIGSECWDRVHS